MKWKLRTTTEEETRSADCRVCGLRLFVNERYSMGRRAHRQGRDADHKNGGPRYLLRAEFLRGTFPLPGHKRVEICITRIEDLS